MSTHSHSTSSSTPFVVHPVNELPQYLNRIGLEAEELAGSHKEAFQEALARWEDAARDFLENVVKSISLSHGLGRDGVELRMFVREEYDLIAGFFRDLATKVGRQKEIKNLDHLPWIVWRKVEYDDANEEAKATGEVGPGSDPEPNFPGAKECSKAALYGYLFAIRHLIFCAVDDDIPGATSEVNTLKMRTYLAYQRSASSMKPYLALERLVVRAWESPSTTIHLQKVICTELAALLAWLQRFSRSWWRVLNSTLQRNVNHARYVSTPHKFPVHGYDSEKPPEGLKDPPNPYLAFIGANLLEEHHTFQHHVHSAPPQPDLARTRNDSRKRPPASSTLSGHVDQRSIAHTSVTDRKRAFYDS